MTQHYMTDGRNTESICGTDMVGRRDPFFDTNATVTNCIACKAILEDRPLYGLSAVDEDGHTDRQVFNTTKEQMAAIEDAFDLGALNVTVQILSVDDLKNGEW